MIRTQFISRFLLLLGVLLLLGCAKDEDVGVSESPYADFAGLAAFNGVEGSTSMQLRIDGKLLNKDNELFAVGDFLNHRTVFPGRRKVEVSDRKASKPALVDDFEFEAGKLYTFFFYGEGPMEHILTQDDLLKPQQGKIRFRVVNLVDDAEINVRVSSPSGSFSHRFDEPGRRNDELSVESLEIRLSADNDQYAPVEFSFQPDDHSVNSLVIYTNRDSLSSRKVLAHQLIEIGR